MDQDFITFAREAFRPPDELKLSEWADLNFYLSAESSAEPGRWRTFPYQRGIMDAISDPEVEQVTFKKSARVGATKMMGATIGYYMDHDPCPIMVVQPTLDDARGYSNEEIKPMLRDCKVLAKLMASNPQGTSQTRLNKNFPGGSLSMIGAESAAGFRRVSRRVVIFDEVDGYTPGAGKDGDQIKLGIKRTEFYANRKIIAASTPLLEGSSRITKLFEDGDQRRYHVACSQCEHRDVLVFRKREDGQGHYMQWPKESPEDAYFVCSENGCVIEHKDKFRMVEGGEWIASEEFDGHASFHIWAAYSMSPNASWGQLAKEYVHAEKAGALELQTFINTALGECFIEKGEAPDWERLHSRRETYLIGGIPENSDIRIITCGVDVQKDRWIYEVVGWGENKESWSLDAGIILGETPNEDEWDKLTELLGRTYGGRPIEMMAVDSGYNTQLCYAWCAKHPLSRVIAIKGMAKGSILLGVPSSVEVKASGRRRRRGYKVWPVVGPIAKKEFYGFLDLGIREGEAPPPGYCHFPEYAEEFFLQITGEHLVKVKKRQGYWFYEWQMIAGRENHWLDCRVYARAAAQNLGLDRAGSKPPPKRQDAHSQTDVAEKRGRPSGFMAGRKGRSGWMKGRR